MNRYRGEVPVVIGKREMILVYDYNALALLREEFGDHGHTRLMAATANLDVEALAKGAEIGLQAKQPGEMNAEQIMKLSPVIQELQEAVYESLIAAFYGPGGIPEENPPTGLRNWWKKKWNQLFRLWGKHSDVE